MTANLWLVHSIRDFSFLNCPECTFRTKEENLFAYHAAKHHPLSTAFFDEQTELEQSTIGLKTVEYSPDLDSKLEAVPTRITDESNDPLECIAINCNESVSQVIEIVPNEPLTCQHCEEKFISFEKLQSHYDECHYNILEEFDESFENDFENIENGTDEPHDDFDDNIVADIGNRGINVEFSQSASQTAILKNHTGGKNLTDVKKEFENESQTMIIEGFTGVLKNFPKQIGDSMFKDSKSFQCKVCDNYFHLQSSLKEHMKSVHENKKPYKCETCDNIFSFQSSLKRHVKKIHEEKRPEKKPRKVYDDSENKPNYSNAPGRSETSELYILDKFCYVKKDMSSKTIYLTCNERNNKDNDCPGYAHIDRITNQMSVKKGHNHSPREEKIAKNSREKISPLCDICGKVYKSQEGLKSHRHDVHDKLKPFECTICMAKFSRQPHLAEHVANVHEGKKEFKCPETDCNKSFGYKGKLKVHIRTVHLKLRLHKCTICDKSYKEKVTLTKHEYAVHGDGNSKPYNCNVCDSRFAFNNKLTRHMKNVHNKKNVRDIDNSDELIIENYLLR